MTDQAIETANALTDFRIPYHIQSDATYCGAAVAQMLLRPLERSLDDQDDLADDNTANDPVGQVNGASIDALVATLNARTSPATFISQQPLGDPLTDAVTALNRTQGGVAASVQGGDHWVALSGVAFDPADPQTATGLYIDDPHAQTEDIVHADDDLCGSGDVYGFANAFWTYAGMLAFSNVPVALVYAPSPSAAEPAGLRAKTGAKAERNRARARTTGVLLEAGSQNTSGTPSPNGAAIPSAIERQAAFDPLETAARAIQAAGIVRRGPLQKILAGFEATNYVQLGSYHQVTLEVNSSVVGYALLSAATGELLAVMASGNERRLLRPSQALVLQELYRHAERVAQTDPDFMPMLRKRHLDLKATLFWRRCREAPLPSQPLMRISIGTRVLYRNHFGRYYRRLRLLDR